MMKRLNANGKTVYEFVKAHEKENITTADIVNATGLGAKQVNGIITMTFCRNKDEEKNVVPLMERISAEMQLEDGTHKPIKLIVLTDAGRDIEIIDVE